MGIIIRLFYNQNQTSRDIHICMWGVGGDEESKTKKLNLSSN